MGAAQIQWPAEDLDIAMFMGLATRHQGGPASTASGISSDRNTTRGNDDGQAVGRLLSHNSFRTRFDRVPADTYVELAVVAWYLGLAKLTIERRLSSVFDNGGLRWRTALSRRMVTGALGPAMVGSRYRWGFVTSELEPAMHAEITRRLGRRTEAMAGALPAAMAWSVQAQTRPLRFVLDAERRVVGALGQGHITAARFISVMNGGGHLLTAHLLDALSMPWTTLAARVPWESAVRQHLAQTVSDVLGRLETGTSRTEAALADPR
jgi:hypothetical protein